MTRDRDDHGGSCLGETQPDGDEEPRGSKGTDSEEVAFARERTGRASVEGGGRTAIFFSGRPRAVCPSASAGVGDAIPRRGFHTVAAARPVALRCAALRRVALTLVVCTRVSVRGNGISLTPFLLAPRSLSLCLSILLSPAAAPPPLRDGVSSIADANTPRLLRLSANLLTVRNRSRDSGRDEERVAPLLSVGVLSDPDPHDFHLLGDSPTRRFRDCRQRFGI